MTTELDEQFEEWLKQTRAESQQNKFGFKPGDRFLAIVASEGMYIDRYWIVFVRRKSLSEEVFRFSTRFGLVDLTNIESGKRPNSFVGNCYDLGFDYRFFKERNHFLSSKSQERRLIARQMYGAGESKRVIAKMLGFSTTGLRMALGEISSRRRSERLLED